MSDDRPEMTEADCIAKWRRLMDRADYYTALCNQALEDGRVADGYERALISARADVTSFLRPPVRWSHGEVPK